MSRAIALVRFNDGTIMEGCYDGTSDVLYRHLIPREELEKRFNGSVYQFIDEIGLAHFKRLNEDEIDDVESVEIYIDYGNGCMWLDGRASKSKRYVTSETNAFFVEESEYIDMWAYKYLSDLGYNLSYIDTRRLVYESSRGNEYDKKNITNNVLYY